MLQSHNPTNGSRSFDDGIREEFKGLEMTTTMMPSEGGMRSILNNIKSPDDGRIDLGQFQTFIQKSIIDSIGNQQLHTDEKTMLEIALFCRIIRTASCNGVDKGFYNRFLPEIDAIVSTLKTKLISSDSEGFKNIGNSLLDKEIPIWNHGAHLSQSENIAGLVHELLVVITRVEGVIGRLKQTLEKVFPKK